MLSPENAEFMKAKAADWLMAGLQKSLDPVTDEKGWISEADAYRLLGVEESPKGRVFPAGKDSQRNRLPLPCHWKLLSIL